MVAACRQNRNCYATKDDERGDLVQRAADRRRHVGGGPGVVQHPGRDTFKTRLPKGPDHMGQTFAYDRIQTALGAGDASA